MANVMPARVLIVSSFVADGSVGGGLAAFALQRLGFDVTFVPTVLMSNRRGKAPLHRIVPPVAEFTSLVAAAADANPPTAILTGFFASAGQVAPIAALIRRLKAAHPEILYVCDPIVGDDEALYVNPAVAEAIREQLLPLADAATPNAFECRFLAGLAPDADLAACAAALPPEVVLVTSAPAMIRGRLGNLLASPRGTLLLEHASVPIAPKGTGDFLSGILLARLLGGHPWPEAARLAVASLCETVSASVVAGSDDLMIAACQDVIVIPRAAIEVRHIVPPVRRDPG